MLTNDDDYNIIVLQMQFFLKRARKIKLKHILYLKKKKNKINTQLINRDTVYDGNTKKRWYIDDD